MNASIYCNFLKHFSNEARILLGDEFANLWFQQDGASSQTAHESRQELRDLFGQNIVGKFFNFNWPPRSPDLSPLDFFLWGYLKNKVYSGVKATTLAGLKLRIQEAFEETRLETMSLIKTYDNALYRMKLVSENGGKHIEISVKNRKNLVV